MKRAPTPAQIAAAMRMYESAAPARTSRAWLVHWLTIAPTVRRYQEPVPLSRVLAEHHAAVAAEPIDNTL